MKVKFQKLPERVSTIGWPFYLLVGQMDKLMDIFELLSAGVKVFHIELIRYK